uniref:Uncharacterized protein n=1 Tax=Candidatus Kentrum sp. SD TaxID=2126332 RepID=A0A450YUY3_9GAMM|nr:MAG: hypothetical protein BECKSD772F_GA0070984_12224 [Candidatus Kentron sp. SD]
MDWTQAFTIIGTIVSINIVLFVYLSNRMDTMNQRLTVLEVEMRNVNQRLSTIEGYLVPRKVFRFEESETKDEPKEN